MSEDTENSPEYDVWISKSRSEDNKENTSTRNPKTIREPGKRVALGARIEVDENIRNKYEPTGSIPKRFGKPSVPSTSTGGAEQLKIPRIPTAIGKRQGDAGVFTKSKFLVFNGEKVSKIEKKPIVEPKKLTIKYMGNSGILEEEVPRRMTQKAYNRAKDFFQNREISALSKEEKARRWSTVHSVGERNRKLLGEIQNLEPVRVEQIIKEHYEAKEKSSVPGISSDCEKKQKSSEFSKDGKDEEVESQGVQKGVRYSRKLDSVEESTGEPSQDIQGPPHPRVKQLIEEYFEPKEISYDVPALRKRQGFSVVSKDGENEEVKTLEVKKKGARLPLRRFVRPEFLKKDMDKDGEGLEKVQEVSPVRKDDEEMKQKREFKYLVKLHSIEGGTKNPSAKIQSLPHFRVQQLIEQHSEARVTPHDVPAPSPEKIKILHKSAHDPEEERAKRNAGSDKGDIDYADYFMAVQKEKDFFRSFDPNWRAINASTDQRQTVVHFLCRLGISNSFPSHIIYKTVRIFDDVLQAMRIPVEKLKLMIISALWIVMKKDYIIYRIPGAEKMSNISDGFYNAEDVRSAEVKILMALNFQLTYPDPFSVLAYFMATMNNGDFLSPEEREDIYYFGGYMIDLALLDEELMKTSSILLAATAAELATTLAMEPEDTLYCTPFIRWRSPYAIEHLKDEEITHHRALLIRNITESCYKTSKSHIIHKKYCRSRYGKVSKKLIEKIQKLVPPNL